MPAVLLLSGGMDSTTLLYLLIKENIDVRPIFINYGQMNYYMEREAIKNLRQQLNLSIKEVTINGIVTNTNFTKTKSKSSFYYPFRNLMLLSVAAIYATEVNADSIYIGLTGTYVPDVIFPDTSKKFLTKVETIFNLYGHELKIYAPFINVEKGVVIYIGKSLGVPYNITYSCYLGDSLHCGTCPACLNRKLAFKRAGVYDETKYKK